MHAIWRVIKSALQDIGRNFGLSFMTVLILILTILSMNILWAVDILTKEAVRLIKEEVNISLYFVADIGEKELNEIKNYLSAFPEVINLQMKPREDVLSSFTERHAMSKEVLAALTELGSNPFGPTMIINTREPGEYKNIIKAVEVPEYENLIEAKSFDQHEEAIERIQNITNRMEKAGFGLSALFALISFIIIFNTVRIAIFTQWTEISIKRLVGAPNWFIRGPYIVESFIFTIISIGAAIAIIFTLLRWIDPYLAIAFPNGFSLTNYYNSHILPVFGLQSVAVFALTIFSSLLAMRKQLKV